VVAVLGALIGIGAYQQAQLEKEQREANQALLELLEKAAESQRQSQTLPEHSAQLEVEIEEQKAQEQNFEGGSEYIDNLCSGSAGCFTEYVTRIVDGDTIYTDTLKIRLSLTNTPEINQSGYSQATQFTEKLCPVGSSILVDQDDLQPVDKYGRVLAKVYCGNRILNSELLYNGYADILTQYCSTSEFSGEAWAQEYGCGQKEIQPTTPPSQPEENSCDPSYPDTCILSPPPDLDCGDISFSNFKVLPPDPHNFDGDKDGIGCEKSTSQPPTSVPPTTKDSDSDGIPDSYDACPFDDESINGYLDEDGCPDEIPKESQTPAPTEEDNCDPSYPTVCIPSPPPDLDCGDITFRNFVVLQPDPHRFDGDKDGIGCES